MHSSVVHNAVRFILHCNKYVHIMHNKWRKKMQTLINNIAKSITKYNRYRRTFRELSNLTNRELADIGIARCDIPNVASNLIRR